MGLGLKIKLSVMMFLQYFVWGIWLPVLALHLGDNGLKLSNDSIGWIFSVGGFGSILGPFIIGQLADRFFATEKVLAASHFVGGILLILTAYLTSFWPIFLVLFIYSALYMPTMGLTNSITFRSLGESNQDAFPSIRLWGTLGWIAAGFFWTFYFGSATKIDAFKPLFDAIGNPTFRDCLRLAGVVSIVYSGYCLMLPHTPPVPVNKPAPAAEIGGHEGEATKAEPSAVLETLSLLKHRSFATLVFSAALIGIVLSFYFACEAPFLVDIGISETQTSAYMTIGQIAETVVMVLVPITVARLGVKQTMLLGAGMWALRFVLSMIGQPQWLMVVSIALHGFCFGFFFVVAQMYVDRAASGDIKASAQNLLIFIIYGIGQIVGSVLSGRLRETFSTKVDDKTITNWMMVWGGPLALTILAVLIFAVLFRDEEIKNKPAAEPDFASA